jgi:hypothetical protein
MNKEVKNFCKQFQITEDQFYGKEVIEGFLNLQWYPNGDRVQTVPDGFNPIVTYFLDMDCVTTIPAGFNPTVGGHLDLSSVKTLPAGFNPTVGGDLWLRSVTTIPEDFNPFVRGDIYHHGEWHEPTNKMPANHIISWQGGKYIKCDGIFGEVLSRKGRVYRCKNSDGEFYIVSGEKFNAHGKTIKEAKTDLRFKELKQDPSEFKKYNLDSVLSKDEMILCYRAITGACQFGVQDFINRKCQNVKKISIKKVLNLTVGEYGHNQFADFFKKIKNYE